MDDYDWDENYSKIMREREDKMYKANMLSSVIPYLFQSGQISFDEFKKYLLDPEGLYIPKLNKK